MSRMIALALALPLAGFALAGCAARPPETPASLRGVVASVTQGANGTASLRVVWDESVGSRLELDAADVTVTADTRAFVTRTGKREDAVKMTAQRIKLRDLVEVWITGPVRESYPVQADAREVLVFGTLKAGRPLPTPPGLMPPTETE